MINAESDRLLVALRLRLFGALDAAEENGDGHMLSRISGQLHHNLEITGKLVGSLASGATSVTNVFRPTFHLRVELVRALAAFPDARQAVAQVLHRLEHTAAEQVKADADRGLAA